MQAAPSFPWIETASVPSGSSQSRRREAALEPVAQETDSFPYSSHI